MMVVITVSSNIVNGYFICVIETFEDVEDMHFESCDFQNLLL
jgi:hypothetical protein